MSWKKTDLILRKRMHQHGLGTLMDAGVLCQQAEALLPGMVRAISVRNSSLHLELSKRQLLSFKSVEGKFLEDLNAYARSKKLQEIKKIRLTFSEE